MAYGLRPDGPQAGSDSRQGDHDNNRRSLVTRMALAESPQIDDAHQAALRYASLGLRVAPIIPGKKHPGLDRWQDAATIDHTIINAWWQGLYGGHGVCIVTGGWFFGLDVDPGAGGIESLQDLEDTYGLLPATWTCITGSGGSHLYFKATNPPRNSASTRLGPGLDIRGDGGQLVAPPTIHPNGMPYAWEAGLAPWEIDLAEAPGWLLALLARPTRLDNTPTKGVTPLGDEDSIAAHINTSTTWEELLVKDGWTPGDWKGDQRPWCRPNKSPRDGWSAIEHRDGPLNVFTTSVPALQRDWADRNGVWCYSRFGFIAATRHHGDRSAAARAARLERNATERSPAPLIGQPTPTPPAEEVEEDGWGDADLGDILAGVFSPPKPSLLRRT